jgi:SAM-dependent methyltransferase
LVDPIAYHYESVFSNKRPVHDPEAWVERVEKFLPFRDAPRVSLLGKEWMWDRVWPLWEDWFRRGLDEKKMDLERVKRLNYDHHRRMTEDHNRIKAEEKLHPETANTRENLDDKAYRDMLAAVPKSGNILELGSASGGQWHVLRDWSEDLTGIDLFEPAVLNSQKEGKNIVLGFVEQMPFDDASMSLIVSRHVMEHVSDIQVALSEIRRVLKPGGYVAAATPHYFPDVEPAHIQQLFLEEWVKEYEKAGFKIISSNLYQCFNLEAHIVAQK